MNLAMIGRLDIIQKLFGNIIVPNEVYQELVIDGKGKAGSRQIAQAKWIAKRKIRNIKLFQLLKKDLDIGEAAAITLAIEAKAQLILLDETDARTVAEIYDLPKTGVIGLLMRAKERRLIQEVKPFLAALRSEANFWIKQNLYEQILYEMKELHIS